MNEDNSVNFPKYLANNLAIAAEEKEYEIIYIIISL